MRALSVVLILAAFIAIANVSTAHAGTVVDSYFILDNDFEGTLHVVLYLERDANGNYYLRYVVHLHPTFGTPTEVTSFNRANPMTRPTRPQEEEEIRRRCDPNGNGVPLWLDPADKIQIDYQIQ